MTAQKKWVNPAGLEDAIDEGGVEVSVCLWFEHEALQKRHDKLQDDIEKTLIYFIEHCHGKKIPASYAKSFILATLNKLAETRDEKQ